MKNQPFSTASREDASSVSKTFLAKIDEVGRCTKSELILLPELLASQALRGFLRIDKLIKFPLGCSLCIA